MKPDHLTAEEIAAYIDRQLSHEDVPRVESHLAECATCRREVTASSGLVITAPAPSQRRNVGRVAAAGAVAAALIATVFMRPQRTDVAVERAEPDAANRVQAVFPLATSRVDAGAVTFTWRRD